MSNPQETYWNYAKDKYDLSDSIGWSPNNITTSLWLDASDSSTIIENGGAVSQWNDKSGNGNNAVQSTGTYQPQYATNSNISNMYGLDFTYTSEHHLEVPAAPELSFATEGSIFVVYDQETTASNVAVITRIEGNRNPSLSFTTGATANPQFLITDDIGMQATGIIWGSSGVLSPSIAGIRYSVSPDTFRISINGESEVIDTHGQTGVAQTSNNIRIGCQKFPNFFRSFDGFIHEIIICNYYVSDTIKRKIEGYLADKWGLTASLPSGHPYRIVPPTVYPPTI